MIITQEIVKMNFLEYKGAGDKIVDQLVGVTNMKEIEQHLENDKDTALIFPVCGKRCFNIVNAYRNKTRPKGVSEYANTQSWDNDGNELNRSSIKVLLDWLTTEENASSYFGGVDTLGRTSAIRKEAYHHHIRGLIKTENGK